MPSGSNKIIIHKSDVKGVKLFLIYFPLKESFKI
jgi:hypothetical protein